jgi:hypothetical protein
MFHLKPSQKAWTLNPRSSFLDAIFCFHKQLRADIKSQITEVALNIRATPTGKQILTLFQIDAITAFKPSLLDITLSLLN